MKIIRLSDNEVQYLKEKLYCVAVANSKSMAMAILKKLNKIDKHKEDINEK